VSIDAGVATRPWTAIRADFPYASECVYLNTAAAGLSWTGQGAAAARFYDDAKRRGYNGMDQWREALTAARTRLAALLGVTESEVCFVGSTTEALNLVTSAIRWRRGDEILLAADEFPSVVFACEQAERRDVRVRRVSVESEADRTSALVDAVTPATRLVAMSHVHWATGTRVDLDRVAAACRAQGSLLMVDGVQAVGATPVDAGGADFYCASVFKWLLSGFGLGILVVRDRVRAGLDPLFRGYNNPEPSTDLQASHVNYPGLQALSATLDYLETQVGWPRVFECVAMHTEHLLDALGQGGLTVVTPRASRAGIVSFMAHDAEHVRNALSHDGIFVEARAGLVRVAPHFYNTREDIDTFVGALFDESKEMTR
jgi:selenocysteine lyase/cysteine desulfurase